ncbi:MAG: hypothetical protein FWG28_06900 [Clostridiales bacterium]|nr:hypothetical protein [Clostridiales bacterium]
MKRDNRFILVAVCVLLALVAALAYLNRGDAALKRALQENRQFVLKAGGETAAVVGLQDIIDIGTEKFTTRLSTSVTLPRDAEFEGAELRTIYARMGVDISEAALFDVRGLDGYFSPLKAEEVAAEGVVYVCISMDGELLADKSAGGWGPYLLVIRGSTFAQRWCKYVEEIDARR